MSSSTSLQILIAGQSGPLSASDAATYGSLDAILALVFADIQKAASSGFTCTPFMINPRSPVEGFKEYEDLLTNRQWDGIVVGFGIRGTKEFSGVFEKIVNMCREKSPTTRMGFSEGPDSLFETLLRMFPERAVD